MTVEGPRRLNGRFIFLTIVSLILCLTVGGCFRGLKRGPVPGVSETLLFRASSKGDLDQVRRLLDGGTNINAREENGETPLMYAAVEDKAAVVELLVDRGADINALSNSDETALTRAVGMSRYESVNLLLNRGADIEKGNPLMYAAGGGDVKMIRLLLQRGAKINATDNEGFTALAAAASRRASPEAIQTLLSAGADTNIKNKRGETPLIIAERNGDNTIVSLLNKSR